MKQGFYNLRFVSGDVKIKVSLRQLADVSLLQRLAESYMKNDVFHVRQRLWSHTFAEGKLRSFALRNVRSAEREIPHACKAPAGLGACKRSAHSVIASAQRIPFYKIPD